MAGKTEAGCCTFCKTQKHTSGNSFATEETQNWRAAMLTAPHIKDTIQILEIKECHTMQILLTDKDTVALCLTYNLTVTQKRDKTTHK